MNPFILVKVGAMLMFLPLLLSSCFLDKGGAVDINIGGNSDELFEKDTVYTFDIQFDEANWEQQLEEHYADDESYIPATLEIGSYKLKDVGVRYRGNATSPLLRGNPKKSLKFKFDEFIDQTFFGLSRLNFNNGIGDPSFLREPLGYEVARNFLPAPRTAFANITIDGEPLGFYVMVEQIDKSFLRTHFKNENGNLYKTTDIEAPLDYVGDDPAVYQAIYQLKTNDAKNNWSGLIRFIKNLSGPEKAESSITDLVNLETTACYLALNMMLSNFNSYTGTARNYYLYEDPLSDRVQIFPWDLNDSFGGDQDGWDIYRADVLSPPTLLQRPLMQRMYDDNTSRSEYLNCLEAMLKGPALPARIEQRIETLRQLIEPHVETDPNKIYTYAHFINNSTQEIQVIETDELRTVPGILSFIERRSAEISTQLESLNQN